MLNKELERVFLTNCAFLPTESQHQVIIQLIDFLLSREQHTVFLLRGYAGTGKTSLIGALVKMLLFLERKVVLLAPTGRAAKVFSLYAEHQAYTIHRKIYRQKTFFGNSDGGVLNANLYQNTLFIVDEASMIANEGSSGVAEFGTGRLLDDLISYVYGGKGCRLILLGDAAQLPPVGETESPALSADMLELYGLTVFSGNLTQVVRQKETSGILWNATALRKLIMDDEVFEFPKIKCLGFPDVRVVSGEDLIETLEWAYNHYGLDQTIVVTRSNKRAQIYNQGIRARVLGREGDRGAALGRSRRAHDRPRPLERALSDLETDERLRRKAVDLVHAPQLRAEHHLLGECPQRGQRPRRGAARPRGRQHARHRPDDGRHRAESVHLCALSRERLARHARRPRNVRHGVHDPALRQNLPHGHCGLEQNAPDAL